MTLTERIQTYLETYADHLGRKVTKSSPLTLQTARKRLYFSDFKEQLVHFNGTVVIYYIYNKVHARLKIEKLTN